MLLSHKKEHIWVSSNEVDESRTYYTEWRKLEGKRQIWYTNAKMWNLENGTKEFIFRAANDTETEENNGHGEREGGGEVYGESNRTHITICKIESQQ